MAGNAPGVAEGVAAGTACSVVITRGGSGADAVRAAQGFAEFFAAAQTQWQVGTGSLLDLEQARRTALSASAGLIQVQRERVAAWITLYKAMGGGWQSTDPTPVAAASMRAPIGSAPPHSPTAR